MPPPNKKIKIAVRNSPLATAQAREVAALLPSGVSFEIKTLDTLGDKNKKIPLTSPDVPDDFFTRELDDEVLSGRAHASVHSAKDLPSELRPGLVLAALTAPADVSDALVSSGNRPLAALKKRAVVGACSELRKKSLLERRPDIRVVPVRGNIGERLALVERGELDAVVVASCALKRLGLSRRIAEVLNFPTHPLQGMLAVTASRDRADVRALFGGIDVRLSWGKVYIVGAGAGCAQFLTLAARKVLERADVVFYDDLVDAAALDGVTGRKIYVGKRKGRHSFSQQRINEMLFDAAARKRQIAVRLKGGDPLIFGRGGEELLYLRARHINAEVIPGITAAQVAATSSRMPLTMRGAGESLSLMSAHRATSRVPSTSARMGRERNETLVFYMAASKIGEVIKTARLRGMKPDTPAVLVSRAGFVDEQITKTTLRGMARAPSEARSAPLTVIVGKTAGLAAPPRDKILFTGLDPLGCFVPGHPVHWPLIKILPLPFKTNLDRYDGIVFTSRPAVDVFCRRYSIPTGYKIISIGARTSGELKKHGYDTDYESPEPDSDVLATVWRREVAERFGVKKVLYPCSNLSDNAVGRLAGVEKKIIYRTSFIKRTRLKLSDFSGVVFSSSSAASAFLRIYRKIPAHLVCYVYGKHTAAFLASRGCEKNVQTISP